MELEQLQAYTLWLLTCIGCPVRCSSSLEAGNFEMEVCVSITMSLFHLKKVILPQWLTGRGHLVGSSCNNWYAACQLCGAIKLLFLRDGTTEPGRGVSVPSSVTYQHVLSWQGVLLGGLW